MITLVAAVVLWGVVHSIMASLSFKGFLRNILGEKTMRGYRFVYNLFSIISFVPILWLMRFLPDRTLYAVPAPWIYFMLIGQGLSVFALLVTLLQTDALAFAGLRQFSDGDKTPALVSSGFYGVVRHPLYLFGLLFLWLTPVMTINLLTVYLLLTIYIFIGATLEERKLAFEFGTAYAEYKSKTPMIIPGLIRRRNQ